MTDIARRFVGECVFHCLTHAFARTVQAYE